MKTKLTKAEKKESDRLTKAFRSIFQSFFDREAVMKDALINIMKRGGRCWDGDRICHDPAEVAHRALRKIDPEAEKYLDTLPYTAVKVFKTGRVSYKGKTKRRPL